MRTARRRAPKKAHTVRLIRNCGYYECPITHCLGFVEVEYVETAVIVDVVLRIDMCEFCYAPLQFAS